MNGGSAQLVEWALGQGPTVVVLLFVVFRVEQSLNRLEKAMTALTAWLQGTAHTPAGGL